MAEVKKNQQNNSYLWKLEKFKMLKLDFKTNTEILTADNFK